MMFTDRKYKTWLASIKVLEEQDLMATASSELLLLLISKVCLIIKKSIKGIFKLYYTVGYLPLVFIFIFKTFYRLI